MINHYKNKWKYFKFILNHFSGFRYVSFLSFIYFLYIKLRTLFKEFKLEKIMGFRNPQNCHSLEEIRNEIDKIDEHIISLFAERHKYVEAIVRFKHDKDAIIAQERKDQVILQRKNWAEEKGLNADTFERIYTLLINSNIKHEMELLKLKNI